MRKGRITISAGGVLLLAALVALWVMRRKSAVPGETIKNNP